MTTLESIEVEVLEDEHADLSYLGEFTSEPGPDDRTIDRGDRGTMGRGEHRYFVAEDADAAEDLWERAEDYGNSWHAVGIRATAEVTIRGTTQTLTSNGVWGVNSDAGDNYLNTVACQEVAALRDVLADIGIEAPPDHEVEWADNWLISGTLDPDKEVEL